MKLRLGATLWFAAMAGVVVLAVTVIPQILERTPRVVPNAVAIAASVAQSGALLSLAVWAGVSLSQPLGLGAPAVEAALSGANAWPALKRQLAPAALGGATAGGLLVFLAGIAPSELFALGKTFQLPAAAKLLYGGVTEEVLMRWGLMTALVWLPWRLIQKRVGLPSPSCMTAAIFVSALLFGVLHLPAIAAMGASISPFVVAYIIVGNAVPGALFGTLYWRYGLAAAIIAHALAHAVGLLVAA
jgi:hypothetical protein